MKQQTKNKTVYFLGAGFSRSANFPLQNELVPKTIDYLPPSIADMDVDLFAAFKRFSQQKLKVQKFLETVFKGTKNPNLEDVFTLLDQSISERLFCKGISWKELVSIDEALKGTILFMLHSASTNADAEQLELYRKISGLMLKQRLSAKDDVSVVSLNWDSLLEDSIYYWINSLNRQNQIDVDYCCYTLPLDGCKNHTPSITQKAAGIKNFKILKLHGSTNWLVCESCKKIYTGVGSESSAFKLYFRQNILCQECDEITATKKPQLLPFIITPTYLKTFSNPHIQNIWLNAYTELNEANKVVFVGYSLPEADFFVRSLLRRAIRNDAEIEVVLWKTDQPNPQQKKLSHFFAKSRYENFFGQHKVTFHFDGLEEFFKPQISDLKRTRTNLRSALIRNSIYNPDTKLL